MGQVAAVLQRAVGGEERGLPYGEFVVVVTIDIAIERSPVVADVVAAHGQDVSGAGHVADGAVA